MGTRREDLLAVLVTPRPGYGSVVAAPVLIPHVAVGLWVATIGVLFLPHPWSDKKLDEHHLLRAYGIITPLFALV